IRQLGQMAMLRFRRWLSSALPLVAYAVVFFAADLLLQWTMLDALGRWLAAGALALMVTWLVTPQGQITLARRAGRIYSALRQAERADPDDNYGDTRRILRGIAPGHEAGQLLATAHTRLRNLE